MGLTSVAVLLSLAVGQATAQAESNDDTALRTRWRAAVERSVPLMERAAREYPNHRECFACHHQTSPLLVQRQAARFGLKVDNATRDSIVEFTRRSFESQREKLETGKSIDGRAITVAYGLLTFELADAPTDPLAQALVTNLLKTQHADGYWEPEAHRPPAEESKLFITALAVRGLRKFAAESQRQAARDAEIRATAWVEKTKCESVDDRAGVVLFQRAIEIPEAARRAAFDALVARQNEDGSWSQRPEMKGDAYATGLAMWSLHESSLPLPPVVRRRALEYLLRTQQADGSWHAVSRCDPVQTFFESGAPHGRDQFLSLLATGWCAALP